MVELLHSIRTICANLNLVRVSSISEFNSVVVGTKRAHCVIGIAQVDGSDVNNIAAFPVDDLRSPIPYGVCYFKDHAFDDYIDLTFTVRSERTGIILIACSTLVMALASKDLFGFQTRSLIIHMEFKMYVIRIEFYN